jgi:aspartyl-tRNA(Asn)/glutamyl-tRNA(Gln) amidotransferase subunit A
MESEILKTHTKLISGSITCHRLIEEKLHELSKSNNNTANFLLTEIALKKAEKIDNKISKGNKIGLMEGIPFGLKDVFLLQGCNASASSMFLKKYIAPYTATAIQKILDSGAIPIVKENCDSFGHGSTNENSIFGPVKNALNEELVAGGSSGGGAVNVAKGYTTFSIGADTGGSIRQPSGYNKVFGLKPTYGRISRYGLMAYASSTDCVGPISLSLKDIVLLLNIMSGKDVHDQTTCDSIPISESVFANRFNTDKTVIGYYKSFIESGNLGPEIKRDFFELIEKLKQNNIKTHELDFFDDNILVSTYYVLAMAETASNLARLDGSCFGVRSNIGNLKLSYMVSRSENLSEETKRRIIGGNQVLSHGHAEEIYLKARLLRNKITNCFKRDFNKVDLILSPVTPCLPPKIGSSLNDPLTMYLSDAYTVGFSIGGLPTLSVPLGTETGIQITAAHNHEELIFKFTKYLMDVFNETR